MRDGPFVFGGRILRVVGVDENGYGPLAGPLVITLVVLEYEGEDPLEDLRLTWFPTLPVRDSKEMFRRTLGSYARGEAVVHWLLKQAGIIPRSARELWEALAPESAQHLLSGPWGLDIPLPVWAKRTGSFPDLRPAVRILEIRSRLLLPEDLRGKNKHQMNLQAFWEHVEASHAAWALLGKLGGMTHYAPHLPEGTRIVEESRDRSIYAMNGVTLAFVRNADRLLLPVAMASVVGKYVRELLMLSVNRLLGHDEAIPWASGYPHDPRTRTLVEEAWKRGWDITRP